MRVSSQLLQAYFLGTRPEGQDRLASQLGEAGNLDYASSWYLFMRLGRPGLVALRQVRRTTGLDLFLLEDRGTDIEDVAEFIAFSMSDDDAGLEREIQSVLNGVGCLFITFIRLNWELLEGTQLWGGYGMPPQTRSRILVSLRSALLRGAREGILSEQDVRFHIAFGTGDSDIIIFGRTTSRDSLDYFLLVLTHLGTDCLAQQLGGEPGTGCAWRPVLSVSATELAVPWLHYQKALSAAASALGKRAGEIQEEEQAAVGANLGLFEGSIEAIIMLRRSNSCLAALNDEVRRVLPPGWTDEVVLGDVDIAVRNTLPTGHEFAHLLQVLARLDAAAQCSSDFPRRSSLVLCFGSPKGQGTHARSSVLWPGVSELGHERSSDAPANRVSGVSECLTYLRRIHDLRFREEFRIIERMVERCHVLQASPELPPHTRQLSRLLMTRIVDVIRQLIAVPQNSRDVRELRQALVNSGSHLERTLSYLTRGSIPLLLSSTIHARVTDHFASETFLGGALSAPVASVAKRLAVAIQNHCTKGGRLACWKALLRTLRDMSRPIIYSSHDVDFKLIPPLGIIHLPRWVLWYPTAASFILHELGHAVLASISMGRLMEATAREVGNASGKFVWCEELAKRGVEGFHALRSQNEDDELPNWLEEQHEIAAELFNRMFAYPVDAGERYFLDQVEHLDSIAGRLRLIARRSFLSRMLSIHVAHQLTREFGLDLWAVPSEEIGETLSRTITQFASYIRRWTDSLVAPASETSDGALDLRSELRLFREEVLFIRPSVREKADHASAPGRAVQRGVFMALVATSLDRTPTDDAILSAQLTWLAILRTSIEPDEADRDDARREAAIINDLASGTIPTSVTRWPERLPRALHSVRRAAAGSVLIEHRFALSLALADWAVVNRGSDFDA